LATAPRNMREPRGNHIFLAEFGLLGGVPA
jgi:hypothetical protein